MSVMSVLEFERATAIVTFDMPVSNGNPIHIAFNGGSYESHSHCIQWRFL